MTKRDFCYLYLTCKDAAEATKISKSLLKKQLIVCAKQIPVEADYRWEGKITHSSETLLIMESRIDLFDKVEKAVTEMHSYDTFVLEAVPIVKVSKKAEQWMQDNLV